MCNRLEEGLSPSGTAMARADQQRVIREVVAVGAVSRAGAGPPGVPGHRP